MIGSQRREKEPKKIFEEIIGEKFPMGKEIVNQLEAQRAPGRIKPKTNTPRHIVIKPTKIKDEDKILKTIRKMTTYKGALIRLSADFLNRNSL